MKNCIIYNNARICVDDLARAVSDIKTRSAWDRGCLLYAADLLADLRELAEYTERERGEVLTLNKAALLNGADGWGAYSWGGCSLIYDCDIAARLCTPSEYKRTRGGGRRPNSREERLDVQARALLHASRFVLNTAARLARAAA